MTIEAFPYSVEATLFKATRNSVTEKQVLLGLTAKFYVSPPTLDRCSQYLGVKYRA